ncbi:hypothetical protein T4B_12879 [Trichinella pseudospiralis]|uniref:Uncharacterized protein n=1 Tax=Trichinella pseudospiralis TaxID=6337 RepID=A0A0V1ETT0_TRIPS|nr:hypothetical protein T4A_418 [Trichinella pseudospiralis]KRZ20570.1 hypothetical protein T4B_12879 [Trichinella pseudospiralis]KRZ42429.1 hypothetical protein T4C_4015 [Trichinella pseudospiralis]
MKFKMRFYDVYDVSDCSPSCDARIPLSCLTVQFLWHFPCKIQAENEYSFIEVKQMEQNVNDITCTHRLSEREYKCSVDELLLYASNEPMARPPII